MRSRILAVSTTLALGTALGVSAFVAAQGASAAGTNPPPLSTTSTADNDRCDARSTDPTCTVVAPPPAAPVVGKDALDAIEAADANDDAAVDEPADSDSADADATEPATTAGSHRRDAAPSGVSRSRGGAVKTADSSGSAGSRADDHTGRSSGSGGAAASTAADHGDGAADDSADDSADSADDDGGQD